jgi:hypothetical protein
VTQKDADVFLGIGLFSAMRNKLSKQNQTVPSSDPVDIIEEFSIHAGTSLHRSPITEVWAKAMRLAEQEDLAAQNQR